MISAIISSLARAYILLIFVYVIMSWIPNVQSAGVLSKIYQALGTLCDPYLNIFKRFIPPIGGVLDITPIIAVIVLELIVRFIVIIL